MSDTAEGISPIERTESLSGDMLAAVEEYNRNESRKNPYDYRWFKAERIQVLERELYLTAGLRGYRIPRSEETDGVKPGQLFAVKMDGSNRVVDIVLADFDIIASLGVTYFLWKRRFERHRKAKRGSQS